METCGNWRVTPSCALRFTVPLLLVSRDGSLRALINMSKRGTVLHCAYINCRKSSDNKRAFGHVNILTDEHQLVYSPWLKSQHDGVVCDCRYSSFSDWWR